MFSGPFNSLELWQSLTSQMATEIARLIMLHAPCLLWALPSLSSSPSVHWPSQLFAFVVRLLAPRSVPLPSRRHPSLILPREHSKLRVPRLHHPWNHPRPSFSREVLEQGSKPQVLTGHSLRISCRKVGAAFSFGNAPSVRMTLFVPQSFL